jgi:hypothetical protein
MIRTGTYKDLNGNNVHVRRTATGYVVRHADGRVETFKAGRA